MIRTVVLAISLVGCLAVNAQAQFTFSPDSLDFGTIARGQDRYLYDTITNSSLNYVWLGSLRDLGPSKRIHIVHPPTQPVGFGVGRKYVFAIEYYADSASDEVDTIVVSQYQNGDGERLIVRGRAVDSAASGIHASSANTPSLTIDSQPIKGDLRATIVLPRSEGLTFIVRDLLGRVVLTDEGYLDRGTHDHLFSTEALSAGTYILEIRSASFRLSRKFVLIH